MSLPKFATSENSIEEIKLNYCYELTGKNNSKMKVVVLAKGSNLFTGESILGFKNLADNKAYFLSEVLFQKISKPLNLK